MRPIGQQCGVVVLCSLQFSISTYLTSKTFVPTCLVSVLNRGSAYGD